MVSHRILLFGGTGQIGTVLQKSSLPSEWSLGAPTREACDLMRPGDIAKAVHDFAPDLVINAAALTNIDACQKDRLRATEINFHAVANIAGQCTNIDAPLIHLSTDYVFDGRDAGHIYMPDDAMNPQNIYGETKMLGEEAVRHGLYWHVIIRTSLVFSAFGENVLTKTLHQIDTQDEIKAVTDQKANPTSAETIAEALIVVTNAILKGKGNGFGTFHVCSDPALSRYEFIQAIMEAYAPYTDRRPRITPILSADIPDRVPRPAFTVMNNEKMTDVYCVQPRGWRDDLDKAVKAYVEKKYDF